MTMTTTSGPGRSLSFLSRNNQGAQRILAWAAMIGIGAAAYVWLLPIVLSIAMMTAKLAILGAFLFVFLMFVLNGRFQWAMGYIVQRLVDLLVGGLVNRDPIGIMKAYLREVRSNISILSARIAEIRGAVKNAEDERTERQEQMEHQEGIVQAAARRGDATTSPVAQAAASMANRRKRSIEGLNREIQQGNAIVDLLQRYLEKAQAYEMDLADSIDFTAKERKRIKASSSAFSAAKRILSGQSIGAEMYDEALNAAREQAAAMVGEMRQFVVESRSAVEGFELEQEGAVHQVLTRLHEREQQSLLLEHQPGQVVDLQQVQAPEPATVTIDRFLRN